MNSPDDRNRTRTGLTEELRNFANEKSWREFHDTYWRLIYNTAVQSGLRDAEAKDVVQETMLSVAKAMGKFDYDRKAGSFRGFILEITKRRIADLHRKRSLPITATDWLPEEGTGTNPIERVPNPDPNPIGTRAKTEWIEWLLGIVLERVRRQVNPKHYQLFHLNVIKEWSVNDIAKTLGVSTDQIYAAKSRILKLIRKELKLLEDKADLRSIASD